MLRRFNLFFTILDEERCEALTESGSENPFDSAQLVLCSLSFLSGPNDRLQQAMNTEWDLLVIDEAHHLEWSGQQASSAYQAVENLSQHSKGLLLLTATPEQLGIEGHFARLRLLDPARYFDLGQFRQEEARYTPVNEVVQTLLAADGLQQIKGKAVQANLAEFLGEESLQSLNNQLVADESDPEPILGRLIQELLDRHGTGRVLFRNTRNSIEGFPGRVLHQHLLTAPDPYDPSDMSAEVDNGGIESLLLPELHLGDKWPLLDPRVAWLESFLQQNRGDKTLVICARAETALQLEEHLRTKHGLHSAVFHEGLSLVARDRAAAWFADEEQGAQALICSEIGSEGRNFQFSHQLVLFDLPLNPDLLEQRIGRLDRIGQRHEVCIHTPCYRDSAQQVLLRWYHEGVNAFERTCAIGQTMYQVFSEPLINCLQNPSDVAAVDQLITATRDKAQTMLEKLQRGRDRLLELNSCNQERATQIVSDILEQEDRQALSGYMERIFDQFGVDQEHHSAGSIVLHHGEHMVGHSFPGLPEDGLTATYQRDIALTREEFDFLTWEHPMVIGAIDTVLNGEFGNTAFCTLKLPLLKAGTILLETIFTVSCPAPATMQLHRYLPSGFTRIVVDSKKNDLSHILTERHFSRFGQRTRRHQAQDFVRQMRPQLVTMIGQAEELAGQQQPALIASAIDQMQCLQKSELERMQALARVNPNIRQEEIDHIETESSQLQDYLEAAQFRLEALRVAVVTN
jgi:ATP-dependent helicase HepA